MSMLNDVVTPQGCLCMDLFAILSPHCVRPGAPWSPPVPPHAPTPVRCPAPLPTPCYQCNWGPLVMLMGPVATRSRACNKIMYQYVCRLSQHAPQEPCLVRRPRPAAAILPMAPHALLSSQTAIKTAVFLQQGYSSKPRRPLLASCSSSDALTAAAPPRQLPSRAGSPAANRDFCMGGCGITRHLSGTR